MKILIKGFLSICFLVIFINGYTQDEFRTVNGKMIIAVISADTVLKLTSNKVLILLNYEDAKFHLKIDKSTFKTGNDSLDKQLLLMKYEVVEFDGKLDIVYVNTTEHSPMDFEVEGVFLSNGNMIYGSGYLEHISSAGTYSCMLSMTFNIKSADLGYELEGLELGEDIKIEIVQAILSKNGD